jgi:UDP-glucose 4-epimerase
MRTILVTGGAGYIGSHLVHELLISGYHVIIIDNFSKSTDGALKRIARNLFGARDFSESVVADRMKIFNIDLSDEDAVSSVFERFPEIWVVFHLAAWKSVTESHEFPERYWINNVGSSKVLFSCMERYGIYNIIYSSSACVYGTPAKVPIPESTELLATNPYGESKITVERMLSEYVEKPQSKWRVVILRYFNPIGAHPSGIIGEDPTSDYPNLLPIITQVALRKRDKLVVFGQDYETIDGTCVRDYIHIMDLVRGHIAAIRKFESTDQHQQNPTKSLNHQQQNYIKSHEQPHKTQSSNQQQNHINSLPHKQQPHKTKSIDPQNNHIKSTTQQTNHIKSIHPQHQSNIKPLHPQHQNYNKWIFNLGTGKGYTILQVIRAFEKASSRTIPLVIADRRKSDPPILIADPTKAKLELDWIAELTLDQMCIDLWRWIENNPNGYIELNNTRNMTSKI